MKIFIAVCAVAIVIGAFVLGGIQEPIQAYATSYVPLGA